MTDIVTRAGKGSPLSNAEVDSNFENLSTEKLEIGQEQANAVANAIPFFDADNALGVDPLLVYKNGRLGLGTDDPLFNVHVVGDVDPVAFCLDGYGSAAPAFITRKANGTEEAPSALVNSSILFSFGARGYKETGWSEFTNVAIIARATENWTDTANGCRLDFATTPNGSTTRTTRMIIGNNGEMLMTASIPSTLPSNGTLVTVGGIGSGGAVNATDAMTVHGVSPTMTFKDTRNGAWSGGETLGALSWFTGDDSVINVHEIARIQAVNDSTSLTTPSGALALFTGIAGEVAAERLRITGDGYFGFGTINPDYAIDLQRESRNGAGDVLLRIKSNNYAGGTDADASLILDAGSLVSSTVTAGSFVPGTRYRIETVGTTDFTLVGAYSSTVGITFIATDVGAGDGTAAVLTSGESEIYFKNTGYDRAYIGWNEDGGYLSIDANLGNSNGIIRLMADGPSGSVQVYSNNTGLTGVTARNILRFVDSDSAAAADQALGMIEFYSGDTDPGSGVAAYILSSLAGSTGGAKLRFGTAPAGGNGSPVDQLVIADTGAVSFGSTGNPGTAGQVLVSNGDAAPEFKTLSMENIPNASFKKAVRVASTVNIATLSGLLTVDGVVLEEGDRILVKNQTLEQNNGIYVASSSAWVRSHDADEANQIAAAIVNIDAGTQGGLTFTNTFKATDTLGTTPMYWLLIAATNYYRTNTTIAGANDTTFRSLIGVGVKLNASTVYEIEGVFWISKTAGATSSYTNFRLVASGGLTANNLLVQYTSRFGGTVTAVEPVDSFGIMSALNTSYALHAASTTAGVSVALYVKGTISVNVAGTLIPSYAQSAASGGSWNCAIGNYFKATPIGPAGVIDVGSWS